MKKLKVKITKCSGLAYWYRNSIGETFDVVATDDWPDCYVVSENAPKARRYVKQQDCTFLHEVISVYICGPITGVAGYNRPAFATAEAQLREQGYDPINPHALCKTIPEGSEWSAYMKRDIPAMLECDMVVMLPCWQASKGAILERHIANELGIPVKSLDQLIPCTIV